MSEDSRNASLFGRDGTRGESQEKTRAEGEEKDSRGEEIRLGEDDTHSLGDERVHEEKHESMEKDGHSVGAHFTKGNLRAVRLENQAWAEGEEESGGDGNLLGRDVRNDLY